MPTDLELLARLALAAVLGGAVGVERTQDEGGDRVQLVVRLPPRYGPERFLEALLGLEGVREVEWER